MGSAKVERLYGAPAQKAQKKAQGGMMTPGQRQKMMEDMAVEGGLVNDSSGKKSQGLKQRGYRLP